MNSQIKKIRNFKGSVSRKSSKCMVALQGLDSWTEIDHTKILTPSDPLPNIKLADFYINKERCEDWYKIEQVYSAFKVLGAPCSSFTVYAYVSGGGESSSTQGIALAVARELLRYIEDHNMDFEFAKKQLGEFGLLTIDHRQTQQKTVGKHKARKPKKKRQ